MVRAYDDGVAFRYMLPEQPAIQDFEIVAETTTYNLDGDRNAYVLPRKNCQTNCERRYRTGPLSEAAADGALVGLPLLLRYPGLAVAVTEAALVDYAGMCLSTGSAPSQLTSELASWPDDPGVKVRGTTPMRSPWRVLMVAKEPGRLVESNLIPNLNEPPVIDDLSWIELGKTLWHWWNGTVAEGLAVFGR